MSSDNRFSYFFNGYNKNYHKAISGTDKENLFKNNVSRLAAAKADIIASRLEELSNMQKAGKISDDDYSKSVAGIVKAMNRTQAAEYNTIVHRNRVAQQFAQFQKEAHLYPNIEWLRTRSATPRELHLSYVGRIWPQNDPFWKSNSPGCIWNCKCSWKSTDEAATDNSNVVRVPASPGLEGNPYFTDEIVSAKHPYFRNVSPHVPNLGPLMNPDDVAFISKQTKNGKEYLEHFNCIAAQETKENSIIVAELLDGGFTDIKLLPIIHKSEIILRERYFGKTYNDIHSTSNPDAYIDGHIVEFKLSNYNNAIKRINEAAKKSNIAVIKATEVFSENAINRIIKSAWKESTNIEKIVIINDGKTLVFNKKGQSD